MHPAIVLHTNWLTRTPPGRSLSVVTADKPPLQEVPDERYATVVALAIHPAADRRRLHPPRPATLRPVGHRPGPQRRGAHHHPVPDRPGPGRRLESPGVLRRVRLLGPPLFARGLGLATRSIASSHLARLPGLGRRRYQGPPHQ